MTKLRSCGAYAARSSTQSSTSATYLRWKGFELTAENRRALYIPKGFAHGFQTLADHAEIAYQISAFYAPEAAGGYRYDDATFSVAWPLPVTRISGRDLG